MSNYKYAIKKLPIKSWIKYWLWRNRTGGTKYKFALSDIKEGTNFYLENTIKRKFNMFELFGKTTQNGTPTPENPIPIVNITGNINEKVQNKNLLPFTNQDFTLNGVRYYVQDGNLYMNGTSIGETSTTNSNFKNNFSFILKAGTYYMSRSTLRVPFTIKKKSDNTTIINDIGSFTLNEDTELYLGFYIYQKTFNNDLIDNILSKGSTVLPYIPHAEQNISFPLAEGQVFAEGDYLADDGIHHVRGKIIYDGSEDENWNKGSSSPSGSVAFYSPKPTNISSTATLSDLLCSNFVNQEVVNGMRLASYLTFYVSTEFGIETTSQWRTWLSTHNIELEYPLAEEYVEPFTEEQQIVYNQIKELYTYNEITNIDGDANLKIKYWERVER